MGTKRLIPDGGTKIPRAARPGQNTKTKTPNSFFKHSVSWRRLRKKMESVNYLQSCPTAVAVTLCYSRLFPFLAMTPPEGMEKTLKLITERQSWNQEQEDEICEVSTQDLKGEEKHKFWRAFSHLNDFLTVISARKMVTVPVQGLIHLM